MILYLTIINTVHVFCTYLIFACWYARVSENILTMKYSRFTVQII